VAWKNGGGRTADIDVAGDPQRPSWRLSIAQIDRDGPFSDFSGYDRTIVAIAGNGVILRAPDTRDETALDESAPPFWFDGAQPIEARLIDGPVRAFNVLTWRRTHAHQLRVHAGPAVLRNVDDAAVYIVPLSGHAIVALRSGAQPHRVCAGDTLRIDRAHAVDIVPSDDAARFITVAIVERTSLR
jgi:environmental stress-induced protein Ves